MKTHYLLFLIASSLPVLFYSQSQSNSKKIRVEIGGSPSSSSAQESSAVSATTGKSENVSATDQLLSQQIESAHQSAKTMYQKLYRNRTLINELFDRIPGNPSTTQAQVLNTEAETAIRVAIEIREEANAQRNNMAAMLGNIGNAEEKELLALSKQQEAISLLEKADPAIALQIKNLIKNQTAVNANESVDETTKKGISEQALTNILRQAANLKKGADELRAAAVNKQGPEKSMLLEEAVSLEKDYLSKKLEASVMTSNLNHEKFYQTRILIASLLNSCKGNNDVVMQARRLNEEAEWAFKTSAEMRNEVDKLTSVASKYGSMSNVEEKEWIALHKQQETVKVLEKGNPMAVK